MSKIIEKKVGYTTKLNLLYGWINCGQRDGWARVRKDNLYLIDSEVG
jgi:hypothetical protein